MNRSIAILAWLFCLASFPVQAHQPRFGIATATKLQFSRDGARLIFVLSYHAAWARQTFALADLNNDGLVQNDEARTFIDQAWQQQVAPGLTCTFAGTPLPLSLQASRQEGLSGKSPPLQFALVYELTAAFPEPLRDDADAALIVTDFVHRGERPEGPHFEVPIDGAVACAWDRSQLPEVDRAGVYVFHTETLRLNLRLLQAKAFCDLIQAGAPAHLRHSTLTPCNCSNKYGIAPGAELRFTDDGIQVTYNLAFIGRWAADAFARIDTDGDETVQQDEAVVFMESLWQERILPRFVCRLDGYAPAVELERVQHFELVGRSAPLLFNLWYVFSLYAPQKFAPDVAHRLSIADEVMQGESPQGPLFIVPIDGHPVQRDFSLSFDWQEPRTPIIDRFGLYAARNDAIVLDFRLTAKTDH